MTHGLPRTRADIAALQAELDRQLAPLQRKAAILHQFAELQDEWDRLNGDVPAATATPDADAQTDAPRTMAKMAKAILQERPGQYIVLRDIWQTAVDRGWIKATRDTRAAMRVALHRLAERDDSIERADRPPTYAYRWLPPGEPEPSRNDAGHGLWEAGVSVR
jgi:hypothetical protein